MQIALCWRNDPPNASDAVAVERKLKGIFGALLPTACVSRRIAGAVSEGILLETPIEGWKAPLFESDSDGETLSLDYPVNAAAVLERRGAASSNGTVLSSLARQMEVDPVPWLRDLAPPFAIIWIEKSGAREALCIQNDGLGFSQLFEYDDGKTWAMSNRMMAFRALGIALVPEPADWAVRCSLGWFPMRQTGFKHVSFVGPATQIRISKAGISRRSFDVIGDWVAGKRMNSGEAIDRGCEAVVDHLRQAKSLWSRASAGLTGGRDSRAVVAALMGADANKNVHLTVRGKERVPDVVLSRALAQRAGLKVRVRSRTALPPSSVEGLRAAFMAALNWQAGYTDILTTKLFPIDDAGRLHRGNVNIMGQHGEIARGFYAQRIGAESMHADAYEDALLAFALQYVRPWLRPRWKNHLEEVVRTAYRQSDAWNLEAADRLDFFYLFERTRRWASGGQYAQPGKVVAPFLDPELIRSVFSLSPRERRNGLIHSALIARLAPSWENIPFASDLTSKQSRKFRREWKKSLSLVERRTIQLQRLLAKLNSAKEAVPAYLSNISKIVRRGNFDRALYWQSVGEPLIHEILARGGFWTEIYDPDLVKRDGWLTAPDDLAVLYLIEAALGESIA